MMTTKIVVHRRCDEPMRRSKEKPGSRWKCKGKCKECLCCIEMDFNGNEEHINLMNNARKRDEL